MRARRLLGPVLVAAVFIGIAPAAFAQANLSVRLQGPDGAFAGQEIDIVIEINNRSDVLALGTESGGTNGYMVDVFLTRSTIPSGFASFSANYFDGVLLRGGRVSNTPDLGPREGTVFRTSVGLPSDTPSGQYRLCASVDPADRVQEREEGDNLACRVLSVSRLVQATPVTGLGLRLRPLFGGQQPSLTVVPETEVTLAPNPVAPPTPTGGGDAERTVLEDGTLQIRFPDGSMQRLQPDGKVVYVQPDGKVLVPMAIQVPMAELPPLPTELAGWGNALGDILSGILQNMLTEVEFQAYLQTEEGKGYYELVDWRLRSIAFLSVPE